MEKLEPSHIAEGNENDAASMENNLAIPQKIKQLPYDPAVLFWGMYPRELKTHVHPKTCTQMFIVALFLIAPKRRHRKCAPPEERANKTWIIHTMEYYSDHQRGGTTGMCCHAGEP